MKQEANQIPKLAYSIREACQATSLGRTNLYEHIAKGNLRVVYVGRRALIPAESLHRLVSGEG
ncbi:excisionase family DNA-binding protein [Altererythrobacter ishigakiensis]|uniref:Excisionase family DNA binding protein n=1 Tax=Altererythrobacter ishigakiensis TaxID=476157 RepID=A0A562UT54_9SPHN|nr:excisionase family DNA binding protein [Altererythrobacter ishigakiensis]